MNFTSLIIPILLTALLIFSVYKKINVYDSFAQGAAKGLKTVFSVFPYLITVFVMTELFDKSGLSEALSKTIAPIFHFFNIPSEITPLILLKPFSGGGSLAVLSEIFKKYGVDSYVSLCASVVYGSSETTFYVSAVYFSQAKEKRLTKPILISLFSTFLSSVFACFICSFFC